jgi:type I restriction enzyme S subunit
MTVAMASGAYSLESVCCAAMNERESCTLAALRGALLPKLISGEPRVKNAERFIKEPTI